MDVTVERVIPLPPEQVAEYAMDWRHDHEWTQGIKRAELTTEAAAGGFGLGAEVTRTAYFLGKRIDYVLKVVGYAPPRLLDMKSVAGRCRCTSRTCSLRTPRARSRASAPVVTPAATTGSPDR